jgi:hypothetical protein
MDYRDVLIDGIRQLNDWLDEALVPLTREQLNWLPEGKTVSAGFNAWHIIRTQDNITNFVFQRKQPIWVEGGYFEKFNLPKVDQGTGMDLAMARGITISDEALLRDYGAAVGKDCVAFLKNVTLETLDEPQMIRPLGEMPKWRVFRQVVMTHGFMHLGEINAIKGQLGLQFAI